MITSVAAESSTRLLAHTSVGQNPAQWDWVLFCSGHHKAEIKSLAKLSPHLQALSRHHIQAHRSCWQDSVPCDCRAEDPIPWWLLARTLSQHFKFACIASHMTFCMFMSNPFHSSNLWLPLLPPARESTLLRKALLIKSNHVHLDNFLF